MTITLELINNGKFTAYEKSEKASAESLASELNETADSEEEYKVEPFQGNRWVIFYYIDGEFYSYI